MRKNDSLKSVRITSAQLKWLQSDAFPFTGSVSQRIRFALSFMEETLASMPTEILELVMSERILHEKTTLTSLYTQYSTLEIETDKIRFWQDEFKKDLNQLESELPPYVKFIESFEGRIPTDEEIDKAFGI